MKYTKTKFIVAVTQRLASAPDSDAKLELIEELSDNLYNRYVDLTADGVPEAEAYGKAMAELGDVNELLAYLSSLQPGEPLPGSAARDDLDSFFSSVREVAQSAMSAARDALDSAAAVMHDAVENASFDKQSAAVFVSGADSCQTDFPSQDLSALDVQLIDGDISVRFDSSPLAPVRLEGDTEELQVTVSNGTLSVRQGKTAASRFFFGRALRSTDIELILPARPWDRINVSAVSGDVQLGPGLTVNRLHIATSNGDVDLSDGLQADELIVKTASGDLDLCQARCGLAVFHSASGDFCGDSFTGSVRLETVSGDIHISGSLQNVRCSSASGDVEASSCVLPESMELSSKSGDCEAAVPDCPGFTLDYHTVSGSLRSDFPLTISSSRSGSAVYKDGGKPLFRLSSVSGSLLLRRRL